MRARFRRVAGENGSIYLGVACKTADQTKYVTTTNNLAADMGSSNYLLSAIKPNLGEWQEVVLYLKGKSTGAATDLEQLIIRVLSQHKLNFMPQCLLVTMRLNQV